MRKTDRPRHHGGVVEILFRLTGKSYKNVGGKVNSWMAFTDILDEVAILGSGVLAAHSEQNPLRSALQAEMQVGTEPWVPDNVEKRFGTTGEIWFDRGQTKPKVSGYLENSSDQLDKSHFAVLVSAHVHTRQDQFPGAGIDSSLRLIEHVHGIAAFGASANEGDDAKGTEIIAPILDLYRCACVKSLAPVAVSEPVTREFRQVEGFAGKMGIHEIKNPVFMIVVDTVSNMRLILKKTIIALDKTSRDYHHRIRARTPRLKYELPRFTIAAVGNGARIYYVTIRVGVEWYDFVPTAPEIRRDRVGFILVQSAP